MIKIYLQCLSHHALRESHPTLQESRSMQRDLHLARILSGTVNHSSENFYIKCSMFYAIIMICNYQFK